MNFIVEDPSEEFQRIRDYVDCINCSTLSSFSKDNLKLGFNQSMATEAKEKFKLNKVTPLLHITS